MSPRRTEPSWGDLRLGIIVVSVGLLALVGVIVLGSGRGPMRPDTYTLYVHPRALREIKICLAMCGNGQAE